MKRDAFRALNIDRLLSPSQQPEGGGRRAKEIMEIIRRDATRERLSMEAIWRINGRVMIGPLEASVTT